MAASNHKVTLDVAIKTQEEKLSKLDSELENIKKKSTELSNKKIQMKIEADTSKLKDVDAQTKKIENQLQAISNAKFHPGAFNIDDSKVDELKSKLKSLENQRINIQADIDNSKLQIEKNTLDMKVAVEKSALDRAKAEADSMDGETINMSLQLAYQNFAQGIQTCKQGVEDLLSAMKEVEQAGIQTEQNMAFLTKNLGADKAKQTFQEISDIVASMPGDDNTMRSVLSTAQAMGNNLNAEEMRQATATMADYMAGSAMMGKMEKETQQDILKYLLDGNTAELERGSIVSSRVDKLKEANTFMERQKAMQEVLNELGYGGISQMDTLYNKQQEWNGMIYNSQAAMAGLWRNAEMGLIDFALGLNESTNGLAGMAIVIGQMVGGPIVELLTGLGQISVGLKSLNDARKALEIGDKLSSLKTSLIDVAVKAKEAAISLASTLKSAIVSAAEGAKTLVVELAKVSKELLINAANALKSAAAWVVDKAARLASALASGIMTAAQWALNIAMSANPIMLVVIAIIALVAAIWYLYNTNETVRESIDRLFDALKRLCSGDWTVRVEFVKMGVDTGLDMADNDASKWIINTFGSQEDKDNLKYYEEHSDEVKQNIANSFNEMFDSIWNNGTQGFLDWLGNIAGIDIMGPLQGFYNGFMQIPQWIDVMTQVSAGLFLGWIGQVSGYFNTISSNAASFGSNFVSQISSAASNAVSSFASGLSGLASAAWAEFNDVLNAIADFGRQAVEAARGIGQQITSAIWQRNSPGIVAQETVKEMTDTNRLFEEGLQGMIPISESYSQKIVDSYNPNLRTDVDSGVGAGGTIINNEFNFVINGDVDNDERMKKFADYIIELMNWDNNTAGRTV